MRWARRWGRALISERYCRLVVVMAMGRGPRGGAELIERHRPNGREATVMAMVGQSRGRALIERQLTPYGNGRRGNSHG
jgi:hypothetical protein